MTRRIEIPGRPTLVLAHLVLDVNGTIAEHGVLIDEVPAMLGELRKTLDVHLLSADTFGSLNSVSSALDVKSHAVKDGHEKVEYVRRLGSHHCAAMGNGANDAAMLQDVALGIAVIGAEGAAAITVAAADVVCRTIEGALGLLLDERALVATLRA